MLSPFAYEALPMRVLFGNGTIAKLAFEAERLGMKRVLVLSTPEQAAQARAIAATLGPLSAGVFSQATMHTPSHITDLALEVVRREAVDGVVSVGGGSTTGLGKAIALRTDLPQIVIPTTYAGSEMTPILGETNNGEKVTQRTLKVLPETTIYDVSLTLSLPVGLTATSGMNAIAHAVEALYAEEGNPIISLMAEDAIAALAAALPVIIERPRDIEARTRAQYGRVAVRRRIGKRGHGAASQALPRARRQFRSTPCGNPYRGLAPRGRLQCRGGSGGDAPHRSRIGRAGCRRRIARPCAEIECADSTQCARGERIGSRPRGGSGNREAIPKSAPAGTRRHPRFAGRRFSGRSAELLRSRPARSRGMSVVDSDFNEETATEIVLSRNAACASPRLKRIMEVLVPHLHAVVRELELTSAEWMAAIEFLTATGQISSDRRQEFILLSDTLGVSMLVDAINNRKTQDVTPSTVLGPFHVDGAPSMAMGENISKDGRGEPLFVSGRVLDEGGEPLEAAVLDVWQTSEDGFYDTQDPRQPDMNLRGRLPYGTRWPLLVSHHRTRVIPDSE